MEVIGLVASIIAIISAFFAFKSWMQGQEIRKEQEREKERLNRHITVKLQCGDKQIELPADLRRGELTRAELLGWLGMIPMKVKGARFSLSYLNTREFSHRLNEILSTDGDALLNIPCNEEEFAQFDVKG